MSSLPPPHSNHLQSIPLSLPLLHTSTSHPCRCTMFLCVSPATAINDCDNCCLHCFACSFPIRYKQSFQSFTKNHKPKFYTVYIIEVTPKDGSPSWTVVRRYSEFAQLQTDLKRALPSKAKLVKLPPKRILTFMGRNMDPAFLQKRKDELGVYLALIVANKVRHAHYLFYSKFSSQPRATLHLDGGEWLGTTHLFVPYSVAVECGQALVVALTWNPSSFKCADP